MAKTYMSNASEKAQGFLYDKIDVTPISIPAGYRQPETSTQIMSRLLLGSGAITRNQWEAMNGILYDTQDSNMDLFNPIWQAMKILKSLLSSLMSIVERLIARRPSRMRRRKSRPMKARSRRAKKSPAVLKRYSLKKRR